MSGIQRLVDIAAIDTLNLENSVSRNRTLTYIAQIATKLLEVGQLEERLEQLERQAGIRRIS